MLPVDGDHLGTLLNSLVFGLTLPEPEYSRTNTYGDLVDLLEFVSYGRVGVYTFLRNVS